MMEKNAGASAAQYLGEEYKDYAMEAAILEAQQNKNTQGVPGTHEPFPVQLHWVLEQTEKDGLSQVVRWAPHGRAFVVHQREQFVEQVLPVYFNQTKFTSFQRQLSLYGFRRVSKGPDRGGYYHPKFLRISRTFTRNITRTKVKNEGPRKAATPGAEPDFYKMPKLSESIGLANASTGGRAGIDLSAATMQTQLRTATAARLNESLPAQYLPPARLSNISDSRLAYQAVVGSPLSSPGLPIPELDRARFLSNRLPGQQQGIGNFPALPTTSQLRTQGLSSLNNPNWLSPSGNLQSVVSRNLPTMSNLMLQPNSTTSRPQNEQRRPSAGEQGLAYGNQQTREVRVPSPSLSDAIARILAANTANDPSLPPGNSDMNRDGSRRGP